MTSLDEIAARRAFPNAFAREFPDRPAVIVAPGGDALTYGELNARSNQIARVLRARGLKDGDHVAFMIENAPMFFLAAWACQRAGLYYSPINTRLTAAEAGYIVRDCDAKAVILSAAFADRAAALITETPDISALRACVHGELDGYERLETLAEAEPVAPIPDEREGQPMLYSSGTTGRPKGIIRPLPDRDVGAPDLLLELLKGLYKFNHDTVYLCPAPLYHAAALWYTLAMQRLGATTIIMPKFEPEAFLAAIADCKVTHTQLVPTMFSRLLKLPEEKRNAHDLSSLEVAIHAAAPCPVQVKEQMIEWWGPIIYEYYAATEGVGYTFVTAQEWLARKGTVGKPVFGEIHIVGEDGAELPAGEEGVVYFGATPEFDYHKDEAKTAETRHPSGWATTGDVGRVDEDGYLYLTDRKAFMIISGGVNIYPQEIENALVIHPEVMDAAVFGVPDADMGEQVKAVIQPVDPSTAGPELAERLRAHCRTELAGYKRPKSFDFIEALPRGENGKLYKTALKASYWKDQRG